eukprot:TRINITY_DN644_c0_g2_i2.p1 TRINITY_DN644_c0_g2~~TRINITY_DN644_c0_g2_i2.p1  ORF type:complete len:330 (-),score=54.50 TRINITY_DN644_c0_g2_i2:55-930(-)
MADHKTLTTELEMMQGSLISIHHLSEKAFSEVTAATDDLDDLKEEECPAAASEMGDIKRSQIYQSRAENLNKMISKTVYINEDSGQKNSTDRGSYEPLSASNRFLAPKSDSFRGSPPISRGSMDNQNRGIAPEPRGSMENQTRSITPQSRHGSVEPSTGFLPEYETMVPRSVGPQSRIVAPQSRVVAPQNEPRSERGVQYESVYEIVTIPKKIIMYDQNSLTPKFMSNSVPQNPSTMSTHNLMSTSAPQLKRAENPIENQRKPSSAPHSPVTRSWVSAKLTDDQRMQPIEE